MIAPAGYQSEPGRFDELVDERGQVRAHWAAVLLSLEALGSPELMRRQGVAQRLLVAEHAGHAVNREVTTGGLDPLPTVIDAAEWAGIEAGITQRMTVIEAVLGDLYGERRLVRDGIVPAEALFGSRSLQLALVGVPVAHPRLTTYGADLVRAADGRWLVLRDHTDAPLGAGYALMNRTVLSRLLPDALRNLRVRPLAPWFTELRRALGEMAPASATNPRTIVLGPGADHPNLAETSYLATQLGYHLVDGNDLAVRDRRVWLRALGGLEPVDVVLRRVPDRSADPVELGPVTAPGAGSGVAGLTHAVRTGVVAVGNSLGSGLADRLWLQPFLDACSRHLLGEPLTMPSIDTWWCGDVAARAEVAARPHDFVLHDTDPVSPRRSVFGSHLSDLDTAEWLSRIDASPYRYVAQPTLDFATTPVLEHGRLRPGRGTVRVHAVRTANSVMVMPGGQGRRVRESEPVVELAGAQGKDVWVVDQSRPIVVPATMRPVQLPQVDLRDSLPTRSAEALWWLGRNAERAEMVARLAKVVVQRAEQHPELLTSTWIDPVAAGMRSVGGLAGDGAITGLFEEITAALGDRPGALADSLANAVASAMSVREFISSTTWQIVNELSSLRHEVARGLDKGDWFVVVESLDRVVVGLAALSGLANESMVRGPGWRFLDLGRRLERALLTLGLVEASLSGHPDADVVEPVYASVLAGLESLVAYRRRYRSDLRLGPLVDLVIADADNPRSLVFSLRRIAEHLTDLPAMPGSDRNHDLVAAARAACAPVKVRRIDEQDRTGALAAMVLGVRGPLLELATTLSTTWFVHPSVHRMQG